MFKFEIGKSYELQNGDTIKVIGRTETKGYECLICSDAVSRYDRSTHSGDAGRTTGTNFDYTHPLNIKR